MCILCVGGCGLLSGMVCLFCLQLVCLYSNTNEDNTAVSGQVESVGIFSFYGMTIKTHYLL